MSRLPTKVGKGAAVWAAAQAIANEIMKLKLNRDEAYVDRIKREFNLRGNEQARAVYDTNPTYWQKLYGSDPLNSPHHPASPPSSLLPPSAGDRSNTYLSPEPMDPGMRGPFGTGEFVPGPAVSSRPLYETRSLIASSDAAPRSAVDNGKPVRQLLRVPDESQAPFSAGASRGTAIPFVDETIRARQALDNSLPAPGAAPWDLSERFGRWSGLGGVLGPVR